MNKKHIVIFDLILVIGSLVLIAGLIGYSRPLVIAPVDGLQTTETAVLFEFEKANLILIDDNLSFTSPQEIYAEDNLVINLKPGIYYWKIIGARESEVRELTVESEIDLKIKESGQNYSVVNAGNTRLNVDIYDRGELKGKIVLDVDESKESSGTEFIGREDEHG